MNRAQIKEQAKTILGRNIFGNTWLLVLVAFLITSVVVSFVGSVIPAVGTFLIAGPLAYGLCIIVLKLVRTGEKVNIGDLLKGFTDDFGQNFVLGLLLSLFVTLWSLLLIVPGIVKAYAYSMAFYVKADHPEYNWRQCLQESVRITNGHKMDLFILDLSFIGWYIVGSFCFGIGTLWVAPYHETSIALYYEEIKNA